MTHSTNAPRIYIIGSTGSDKTTLAKQIYSISQ